MAGLGHQLVKNIDKSNASQGNFTDAFKSTVPAAAGGLLFAGATATAAGTYAANAWTFANLGTALMSIPGASAIPAIGAALISPPGLTAVAVGVVSLFAAKGLWWMGKGIGGFFASAGKFLFGNAIETIKNLQKKQILSKMTGDEVTEIQSVGTTEVEKLKAIENYGQVRKAFTERASKEVDKVFDKSIKASMTPDQVNEVKKVLAAHLKVVSSQVLTHVKNSGFKPLLASKLRVGDNLTDPDIQKIVNDATNDFATKLATLRTSLIPTPPAPANPAPAPVPPAGAPPPAAAPVVPVNSAAYKAEVDQRKNDVERIIEPDMDGAENYTAIAEPIRREFGGDVEKRIEEMFLVAERVTDKTKRDPLMADIETRVKTQIDRVGNALRSTPPSLNEGLLKEVTRELRNLGIDIWMQHDPDNTRFTGTKPEEQLARDCEILTKKFLRPSEGADAAAFQAAYATYRGAYDDYQKRLIALMSNPAKKAKAKTLDTAMDREFVRGVASLAKECNQLVDNLRKRDETASDRGSVLVNSRRAVETIVMSMEANYKARVEALEK